VIVRLAEEPDAARLAELHATRITDGFLPTLGPAFLTRLYRRIVRSPDAFAYVATLGDEGAANRRVVGFAAATVDIGRLYRTFALRDGLVAGAVAAPRLLRSWRRVLETIRYPAAESRTGPADGREAELPAAEILAVAVEAESGQRGIGRAVVDAATSRLSGRGETAVKVVAGADNTAALRLYAACGFVPRARIEVHEGAPSEVLVWNSSSR
jgi:ribosomal protein S18 acetylase RimI-like enzyme